MRAETEALARPMLLQALARKSGPELPPEPALVAMLALTYTGGRLAEARACLRMLRKYRELEADELLRQGFLQLYLGAADAALTSFRLAAEHPDHDRAFVPLGIAFALFVLGDIDEAQREFDGLAAESNGLTSPAVMAEACRALRDGRAAESQLPPLPGMLAEVADVLQLRQIQGPAGAAQHADAVAGTVDADAAEALELLSIQWWLEAGDHATAGARVRGALERDPDSGIAWWLSGVLLAKLGEVERSHEAFQRAAAGAPLLARAWAGCAAGLTQRGEHERARDTLAVATFLDADDPDLWRDTAIVADRLGAPAEVKAALGRAIDLGVDTVEHRLKRAEASLDVGDQLGASRDLEVALAKRPSPQQEQLAHELMAAIASRTDDRFVLREEDLE